MLDRNSLVSTLVPGRAFVTNRVILPSPLSTRNLPDERALVAAGTHNRLGETVRICEAHFMVTGSLHQTKKPKFFR